MSREVAQIGLGIVGAIAGATVGAPGLGFALGSTLGGILVPQQLPDQVGPRIEDLTLATAAYGTPIMVVYGTLRVPGEVIYSTDRREREHREEVSGGKGGPSQVQITYTYDIDIAFRLCEGEVDNLLQIWAFGKLLTNQSASASLNTRIASTRRYNSLEIYPGDETQLPDPTIEAGVGAGNAPAWRGHAYLSLNNLQLADFANNPPPITAVVTSAGTLAVTPINSFSGTNSGNFLSGHTIRASGSSPGVIDNNGRALFYRASATYGVITIETYEEVAGRPGRLDRRTIEGTDVPDNGPAEVMLTQGPFYNIGTVSFCPDSRMVGCILTSNYLFFADFSRNIYKKLPLPILAFSPTIDYEYVLAYIGDYVYIQLRNSIVGNGMAIVRYDISTGDQSVLFTGTTQLYQNYNIGGDSSAFALYNRNTHDLTEWPNGSDSPVVYSGVFADMTGTTDQGQAWDCAVHRVGSDYYYVGSRIRRQNLITGAYDNVVIPSVGLAALHHFREGAFRTTDASANSAWYTLGIAPGASPSLESVLTNICTRHTADFADPPLTAADLSFSGLSGLTVTGYAITRQMSRRAALEPLLTAYSIGAVESEGKIKFKALTGAVDEVLDPDDLGAGPYGSKGPDPIEITVLDDKQLALRVEVHYIDAARNYDQNVQSAQRRMTVISSEQVLRIDLAMVFTADQAKQLAEIVLQRIWVGRTKYRLSLPGNKYSHLEALDVVQVTYQSLTHTILIEQKDEAAGVVTFQGRADSAAAYVSDAVGTNPEQGITATIALPGPTILELIDSHTLRNNDSAPGYYAAVAGVTDDWRGAVLYQAIDNGETYLEKTAFAGGAAIGIATTALGNYDSAIFDRKNTLTVLLYGDVILTAAMDREALLNGGNVALLGNNTTGWEVIQYRDVVDNGNGSWTISYLLRGRRGTEHLTGGHVAGDVFIALDAAGMKYIEAGLADRNVGKQYLAASIGGDVNDVDIDDYTWTGRGLLPLSVHHARGKRSGADLTVEWIARKRLNMAWRSQVPVPNDENGLEQYQIDVMNGSVVLNTYTLTDTTTWTYTSAQQTADGVPVPTAINMNLYRMSGNVTGLRGYPLNVTL